MALGINTFVKYASRFYRWARGDRAHRLTETVSGLTDDILADTMRQVMRWGLPLADTPEDALVYLLRDNGMPAYVETYQQTLDRGQAFADVLPIAGSTVMLTAQAALCGLINPVLVNELTETKFCFTADNIGFQPRWGDVGLTWGQNGLVWGYQVDKNVAKSLRNMLAFYRPAREEYTGVKPTYWEPSLFAGLVSWFEAKHGTESAGDYTDFPDQGSIGGTHDITSTDPAKLDLLRSGSTVAEWTNNGRADHDGLAFDWRGLNGTEDGFFWWAGTLLASDVSKLCATTDGGATQVGMRLFWNGGTLTVSIGNGASLVLNNSDTISPGYCLIAVSIDTSVGSFGTATVYINGVENATLGGAFAADPLVDTDPQYPLRCNGGTRLGDPVGNDFHSFGWVRGRPAILPDVSLLLNYFKGELSGTWDPTTDADYALDMNPETAADFTYTGSDINTFTDPASGVVFDDGGPGLEPQLSADYFAGGQDAMRVQTGDFMSNTGDGAVLGDLSDSTWFYVAHAATPVNGALLLAQASTGAIYEKSVAGFIGFADPTVRNTAQAPPTTPYVVGLSLDSGGGSGDYNYMGEALAATAYDNTFVPDATALTLGVANTDGYYGRFFCIARTLTADETKQIVLALQGQYLLPTIAS